MGAHGLNSFSAGAGPARGTDLAPWLFCKDMRAEEKDCETEPGTGERRGDFLKTVAVPYVFF